MDFLQSAILGLVQGLTEFIPVSSTGHLILARNIMGLDLIGSLSFDAILQLATGLAVLVYFWKDILNILRAREGKLFWALVIGTIPAVILGILLQDYMDTVFRGTHVVAYALIAGAVLFYLAEKYNRPGHQNVRPSSAEEREAVRVVNLSSASSSLVKEECQSADKAVVSVGRGLGIGLFQCLALIPGMSRSGSTISGGLFLGLNREMATRFSFLLSLPIIFGSGLKKIWDLYQTGALAQIESSLYIASIFAFVSGLMAIHFLIKFLKNHSLNYFGAYRLLLAIVILIWL